MPRHFLTHLRSVFEFAEPARFERDPDGGFFVSTATGQQVFSIASHGFWSPLKMEALIGSACLGPG